MKEKQSIVYELEARGWTEADIASHVGKTTKSVQFWRNGTHNPTGENLRKLQELLAKPPKGTETVGIDLGTDVREIKATNEVILAAVAELLAKATNQSSTVVSEQLQDLVNKRLKSPERGLPRVGA